MCLISFMFLLSLIILVERLFIEEWRKKERKKIKTTHTQTQSKSPYIKDAGTVYETDLPSVLPTPKGSVNVCITLEDT